MKCVVLGSNSFAGSVFVDAVLNEGYEVIGISRSPEIKDIFAVYKKNKRANAFTFHQLDLNSDLDRIVEVIKITKPEYIIDFAGQGMVAESWAHPEQWYQTNIISKAKLHEFIRHCGWIKKYIRISTPEVYGSSSELIDESARYNPSTPYAVSHASIDMSLMAYFRNYNFPVVLTRFANFFGPGQQLYRIIPRTILYIRTGKKLKLHGGGTSVRSFIYAKDVAKGIVSVMNSGEIGSIYHFSTNEYSTIRQVVETICQRTGANFDDVVEIGEDRLGKDHAYLMDSKKARNELNWRPKYTLGEGIERTIEWIDESLDSIKEQAWDYIHKV